jgi:hypothetical protein
MSMRLRHRKRIFSVSPSLNRASRVAIGLLAVCQLAIALAGCGTTIRATVSVPQVPDSSTGKVSEVGVLRLTQAELTFWTHMYNYHQTDRRGAQPPVGLWLRLDAKDDNFTFDPGAVTLRGDNEEPARPITFLGPATPWESPRAVGMGCGPRVYSWGWAWHKVNVTTDDMKYGNAAKGVWKQSPGPVPLKGSTCFILEFDTDPDPDRTFVLSVQGVERGGEPFLIPDITFSKGSARKLVSAP